MNKKTITVITLQNVRNYGSVLQALATQHVMETLGLKCDFLDYWKCGGDSNIKRALNWSKDFNLFKRLLSIVILLPSFWKQSWLFDKFNRNHLHLKQGHFTNEEEIESGLKIDSDIYCTGSDQTWNSGWNNGLLPELFLKFVPDNVKKISYAASFGKNELADWEKEDTLSLLSRYDAISVRESSAVKICDELGIEGAVHVLDPTLQVDKNFWLSILSDKQKVRKDKGKYVLIYQLNANSLFDSYAKEFAKRKGWKLIRFCTRYDQFFKCGKSALVPQVEEFVSLIANAGCVITDSFHATAFSCNMNVPMISIYPNDYSSRLDSLLKLFGLEDRHLTNYDDYSFVNNTCVDFSKVNAILGREREVGWDYLRKSIKI